TLAVFLLAARAPSGAQPDATSLDPAFLIQSAEVKRAFRYPDSPRRLSFANHTGGYAQWRDRCKEKLTELLNVKQPAPCAVKELRQTVYHGVRIKALIMTVSDDLAIPAYLLAPEKPAETTNAILAIHGHGTVEPCVGARDEYHHRFAWELARA